MIVANISTHIGIDISAEHYYCKYVIVDDNYIPSIYCLSMYNGSTLTREILSTNEASYFNRKDNSHQYTIGTIVNRFNSIMDIHENLLKMFATEDIITYFNNTIFNDMLYLKNGKNIGVDAFNDVWLSLPTQCVKSVLDKKTNIQIKCKNCKSSYNINDVSYTKIWISEEIIFFLSKDDIEQCCDNCELRWNIIL